MDQQHVCSPYRNVRGEVIDPAQQGGIGCPVCYPEDGRDPAGPKEEGDTHAD